MRKFSKGDKCYCSDMYGATIGIEIKSRTDDSITYVYVDDPGKEQHTSGILLRETKSGDRVSQGEAIIAWEYMPKLFDESTVQRGYFEAVNEEGVQPLKLSIWGIRCKLVASGEPVEVQVEAASMNEALFKVGGFIGTPGEQKPLVWTSVQHVSDTYKPLREPEWEVPSGISKPASTQTQPKQEIAAVSYQNAQSRVDQMINTAPVTQKESTVDPEPEVAEAKAEVSESTNCSYSDYGLISDDGTMMPPVSAESVSGTEGSEKPPIKKDTSDHLRLVRDDEIPLDLLSRATRAQEQMLSLRRTLQKRHLQ